MKCVHADLCSVTNLGSVNVLVFSEDDLRCRH